MRSRILVQDHMFPLPFGLIIVKDFGYLETKDFFKGILKGRHLILSGHPQTFINWLKNFDDIWVSEDENPQEPFMLANIKKQFQ